AVAVAGRRAARPRLQQERGGKDPRRQCAARLPDGRRGAEEAQGRRVRSRPRYADVRARFTWEPSFRALGWTPDGPGNLGETIGDGHAATGRVALRWFGKAGTSRDCTFADLAQLSSLFAGVLAARGVVKGDRVAGLLPRIPETLIAMLGTWKLGGIYVPIF